MTRRIHVLIAICGMISACGSVGCKSAGKSGSAAPAPTETYVPPGPATYGFQAAPPADDAVAQPSGYQGSRYQGSDIGSPSAPRAANRAGASSCPNCASGSCSM